MTWQMVCGNCSWKDYLGGYLQLIAALDPTSSNHRMLLARSRYLDYIGKDVAVYAN